MTDARDFSQSPGTELPEVPKHITFKIDRTFKDDEAIEDSPEECVAEDAADYVMRPRAGSHHLSSTKVPSRRWLKIQARFWRACMTLGMFFHSYPTPRPPKPSFVHKIQTDTIPIELFFYVPPGYHNTFRDNPHHRYPVIVNFHGGGFCLGHATDDRYYARVMMAHTSAIFVSVNYRMAPEHPFPIPVDDGVEALLYLATHADDYHIDPSKIALTGFSAGANLSLTIPFRLAFHTDQVRPRKYSSPESAIPSATTSPAISRINTRQETPDIITTTSSSDYDGSADASSLLTGRTREADTKPLSRDAVINAATPAELSHTHTNTDSFHESNANSLQVPTLDRAQSSRPRLIQAKSSSRILKLLNPTLSATAPKENAPKPGYEALKVLTIVSWYPLLDWTSSRNSKRRSAVNPAKTLNPLFTNLFDYSYLPPPDVEGNHVSPYASPGLAPDRMLLNGLPQRIQLWLCEYDMLLQEGKQFSDRLAKLGKEISTTLVDGVPHGWDKSPNPFRNQAEIDKLYVQAAERLEHVFEEARQKPHAVAGERIGLGGRQ